jgi:G3E family GTPase
MYSESSTIPVTVIAGFLGAGKTTLLNNLIREYPEKKYAIIENEFGEIGLDSELVINIDNSNICELANGCICCTLNDDLADLLKDLLNSGKLFNHLLVETEMELQTHLWSS